MINVIYGAQAIALGAYYAMSKINPEREISCFLVTEMGKNHSNICGIPVKELAEFSASYDAKDKQDIYVWIATPEPVMEDIEKALIEHEFNNIIRVTSIIWAGMQREAFRGNNKFTPLEDYDEGAIGVDLKIYKAQFYKDCCLSSKYKDMPYIVPIQVGAQLTDKRIAKVLDNMGENISEKNGNYSELTGLYWIWKNCLSICDDTKKTYYGLVHYRRLFFLSEKDIKRLYSNEIDVILPYPMPYYPNIMSHPRKYLSEGEWNAVIRAVNELYPEYDLEFKEILSQENFYNYNIIIARDEVLKAYCEWLFPILFRIEEICNEDVIKVPNRYIGYVGELLETFFFLRNEGNYKIAHTGCRFLI